LARRAASARQRTVPGQAESSGERWVESRADLWLHLRLKPFIELFDNEIVLD